VGRHGTQRVLRRPQQESSKVLRPLPQLWNSWEIHGDMMNQLHIDNCWLVVSTALKNISQLGPLLESLYHWIGFHGKNLTGNHGKITIKYRAFRLKCSDHPIV